MRLLSSDRADLPAGAPVDDDLLRALYAFPAAGGVRSNFVSTLDGGGTGADGLTGSINNAAATCSGSRDASKAAQKPPMLCPAR